jgi:hypothetical protein
MAATTPRHAAGLRCQGRLGGAGCDAPAYGDAALARGLSEQALASLREAQLDAQRVALSAQFAAERRDLQRQLAEAEARGGRVETLRLDVIDRILTPRCPRCSRAFLGFAGCFALRCAPDEHEPGAARATERGFCGAAFCGWCLADCGDDAHPHVRTCPHNKVAGGGYFGGLDLFQAARREAQARSLDAYMQTLEPALRTALRRALQGDLEALGLA